MSRKISVETSLVRERICKSVCFFESCSRSEIKKNALKTPKEIVTVAYTHATLFRLHEEGTTTDINFDDTIQRILEYLPVQITKKSTTQTTHMHLISSHIYVFEHAAKPEKS